MAHVQDTWYSPGPDGEDRPTARHGHGRRWKARYLDPDGRERSKAFARKVDAEKFLTEVEHSKLAGSYLDPDAGRVTLRSRVPLWLDSLTCDPTTRHHIEGRVTRHILPKLGDKRLDVLAKSPSIVQAWVAGLPVGASYAQQILTDLSAVLDQAVADSLIAANPCKSAIVKAPRAVKRKLVPWTRERVAEVRAALPERYRAMVDACGGLGLRQGEAFGLSLGEVDWLKRVVHVRVQIRLHLGVHPVYAPPKGGKDRYVLLPAQVSLPLAAHLERFPARAVALPWLRPDGKPHTEKLIFTGDKGGALNRAAFNEKVWGPARRKAGVPDGKDADAAGMHQLRHFYASSLIRGGVDIKRVQEYLGHHSAAFTLDAYGHLIRDDEEQSLRQVEAALGMPEPEKNLANRTDRVE
jgi:integrase